MDTHMTCAACNKHRFILTVLLKIYNKTYYQTQAYRCQAWTRLMTPRVTTKLISADNTCENTTAFSSLNVFSNKVWAQGRYTTINGAESRFLPELWPRTFLHPPEGINTSQLSHNMSTGVSSLDKPPNSRGGSRKKIFGGPGPSSFGRQQRAELLCPLSSIKQLTGWAKKNCTRLSLQ